MKNEYIYERKGKKGLTLQVKVPAGKGPSRSFRTASIKCSDYPSKAAAYQYARMVRDRYVVESHVAGVVEKKTVADLYSDYWAVSPNTIQTKKLYDRIYRSTVAPLENKRIEDVSSYDIQALLVDFSAGHSERNIRFAVTIWRNIYRIAQMQGINVSDKTLTLLPVHSRHKIRPKRRETVVSYDLFVKFQNVLIGRENCRPKTEKIDRDIWYMLWIMYYTGCRPAEVLALEASDIDFQAHRLKINKSIGSTKTAWRQVVATKRPQSIRTIPMCEELETLFRDLLNRSQTSPLLLETDGLPYDINRIDERIAVIQRKTGILFNTYQLRHMFSDDLFASHVPPSVIRDLMGHASATMSLDYSKATDDQKTEAIRSREKNGNKFEND